MIFITFLIFLIVGLIPQFNIFNSEVFDSFCLFNFSLLILEKENISNLFSCYFTIISRYEMILIENVGLFIVCYQECLLRRNFKYIIFRSTVNYPP